MPAARLPRWVNRYPPRGFAPRSAGRYTKPRGSPLLTTGTTSAVPLRGVNFARRSGVNIESRLTPADFTRVIVDTTVAEKDVAFPTNAKLIHKARERLVKQARRAGIKLRQSYTRVGKTALIAHQRYAHAKQYKRARRQLSVRPGTL